MHKISVVMPVYNQKESYLREAIESILNQTYTDFEFIIVNDGSTNNAEEIILSYKDDRIVYIKQENQGVAKALNKGLDNAQGEYIARMDSDDISLPHRLAKQVEYLEKHPEVSILGSWYESFPENKIIKIRENIRFLDVLSGGCLCHPSVMMRKKDLAKYNLIYNPDFSSEDYELWSRAVKYLNIKNIPEVLIKYRNHENNISHKPNIFKDSDRKIREGMLNYLTDNKNLQAKILYDTSIKNIHYKLAEKIFSIKNIEIGIKKYKVVTILGKSVYLTKRCCGVLVNEQ